MPSRFHEWLIDQVNSSIGEYPECIPFRRKYPHLGRGIEPFVPHALMGLDMSRKADSYIFGGDRMGPPVFIEVGEMRPYDKWSHVIWRDGKPPRILRVCFDGGVYVLNPRDTKFERDLVAEIKKKLQNVWHLKPC
jgi:hypothetical protein